MIPAKECSTRANSKNAAIGAADIGNSPTKSVFPASINYVNLYGEEREFPVLPESLPAAKCSEIILAIELYEHAFCLNFGSENVLGLKFDGISYPADKTLQEIHELIDLGKPTRVTVEWKDMPAVKEILERKTGKNGAWKIEHFGELGFCSNDFSSLQDAEKFIKDFSEDMARLNIGLKSEVQTVGGLSKHSRPAYNALIYIPVLEAKKIIRAAAASEIYSAAPFVAQAMRDPENNSLGMLPLNVLCNLGPFLAPTLPREDAFEEMKNKIQQSKDMFFEKEKFLRIKPIQAKGVRASIGATSCLLLDKSWMGRAQAEKLENIAGLDFSQKGLDLKFPNKEYAERFFHGLKNSGYSSIAFYEGASGDKFGEYEAVVHIEKLHEVKKFVEVTCGYGSSYTKDLFGTSKGIALDTNFFIDELTYIGNLKNSSAAQKKQMAKAVLDGFLDRLKPSEAVGLQQAISELARPNAKEEPGPLQFLRERTGMKSIMPGVSYSDEAGAYKAALAKIGKLIAERG